MALQRIQKEISELEDHFIVYQTQNPWVKKISFLVTDENSPFSEKI
jgi:hypothetical protein